MDRERHSTRVVTHFVLCSVGLSLLLQHIYFSTVVAQSNSVGSPPRELRRNYIAGDRGGKVNKSEAVLLGSKDLCLNALSSSITNGTLAGILLAMYACEDTDNSRFQYIESSNAVIVLIWNLTFLINHCSLDDSQVGSTYQHISALNECHSTAKTHHCLLQEDGLHQNCNDGPGKVTQLVCTDAGLNCSLSFGFVGDVSYLSCRCTSRALDEAHIPQASHFPRTFLSFNSSARSLSNLGWTSATPVLIECTAAHRSSIDFSCQSTNCRPRVNYAAVRILGNVPVPTAPVRENEATHRPGLSTALKVTAGILALVMLLPTLYCCYKLWRKSQQSDTHFVKGISCQSDKDSVNASFKGGSRSCCGVFENQYTWQELETATNDFAMGLDNGSGSGSLLYLAEFSDGLLAAVKVDFHKQEWSSDEAFKHEVAIFQRLHHAYLVNLIGVCVGEGTQRGLVFEYMPNGNLFDRLHSTVQDKEPLSWQIRMVIAYQVACALQYLHEEANPPIIHRDVNASNVLLQSDDSAKLAGFHLSKTERDNILSAEIKGHAPAVKRGANGYLDPVCGNITTGRVSSKKSDVYSYGALLLELISGIPTNLDSKLSANFLTSPEEMVKLVDPKLLGKFNKHELSEVIDIVLNCQKVDGRSRPTMSDVVFMLRDGFVSV